MKKNIVTFLSIVMYRIILEYIYVDLLHKNYGFVFLIDSNLFYYIISWGIFTIYTIYIVKLFDFKEKIISSEIVVAILFLISYIPSNILYVFNSIKVSDFVILNFFWMLIFILYELKNFYFQYRYNTVKINVFNPKLKIYLYNIIVLFAALFIVYTSINLYGKIYIHFSLDDVYELRSNIILSRYSTIYSLLLTWCGFVIIPIAALEFFNQKKYVKFTILIFIQLVSFSIAGHKTQFFLIPVGLLASKILNKRNVAKIPFILCLLCIFTVFEIQFLDTDNLLNYIIRRVLFIPALLSAYYLDYFSMMPKLLFMEDMFISRIAKNFFNLSGNYNMPASKIIGASYFGSKTMYSNTGLFAYGYADAGVLGVILSAFSLILMLVIIDWLTNNNDTKFTAVVIVICVSMLTNVSTNTFFYNYLIPLIFMKIITIDNKEKNETSLNNHDNL